MAEDNRMTMREVYDRHFDDVYGYVAYRLAPDLSSAADVTQEVFLAALAAWDSYRGEGEVLAWLRGIARRKVADHFGRRRVTSQYDDLENLAAAGDDDENHARHRAMLLAEAMRRLPPRSVELLEEKYLEGFSVRRMAEQHARSEKAIESALHRARESLRAEFTRLKNQREASHG